MRELIKAHPVLAKSCYLIAYDVLLNNIQHSTGGFLKELPTRSNSAADLILAQDPLPPRLSCLLL